VTTVSPGANEPGQPRPTTGAFTTNLPTPTVALAIGAHPDDVEFGCGGTLARWAMAGCTVHYLVLTDGSKGTWDVDADLTALVATRQHEQRAAARAVGAQGEVVFVGEVDGELEPTRRLRDAVAEWIRRLKPVVILGHDPWKRYRLHPDHRAAGLITCDAVVVARDPHFLPGLDVAHHRPSTLLLFEADEVNHLEDVSATVAAKLAALEAHASQFESTMGAADEAGLEQFRRRIRNRLAEHGRRMGVVAAEAFARISDV
jgi:LmbE family N-acetylglucosaminyl deacetylase